MQNIIEDLSEKAQKAIINNGQIILGSGVKTFEKNFSKWINDKIDAEQLLAVGSGTDALELGIEKYKYIPW